MARFDNNSRSDERHELAPQLELGCQREADRYETATTLSLSASQ